MLLVLERLVASMKCRMKAMACKRTVTGEWDVNYLMTSSQRLLYAYREEQCQSGYRREEEKRDSYHSHLEIQVQVHACSFSIGLVSDEEARKAFYQSTSYIICYIIFLSL